MATKSIKDIIQKGILRVSRHRVDLNDSGLHQYLAKRSKTKIFQFEKDLDQEITSTDKVLKRLVAALPVKTIGMSQLVIDYQE